QVTAADTLPAGIDFDAKLMPDSNTVWKPIVAERRGLVNLTRLYGAAASKRIAWLRATIHSDDARGCTLRLGFLNEVWVWVNGRLLYLDKNYYGEPIAKQLGRLSIDNSTLTVPLQKGDNEILVGVGNAFYGWGIAARLDDTNGIELR
ncbi:MAG TPA: hypothetical protein VKU83_10370, partial [Puia sp.]|nr:hypothetical protein [Puia sp.]